MKTGKDQTVRGSRAENPWNAARAVRVCTFGEHRPAFRVLARISGWASDSVSSVGGRRGRRA